METLAEIIAKGERAEAHRPWPRVEVDAALWQLAVFGLRDARLTLLGLWGDRDAVHMALRNAGDGTIAVLSLTCPAGRFPSVGVAHPPAIRLERTVRDLFGLEPDGAVDWRSWLDHGKW